MFLESILYAKHCGEHGGYTVTKPYHHEAQGLPGRQTGSRISVEVEERQGAVGTQRRALKSTALSTWVKLGCAINNLHLGGVSNEQLSHACVTCISQVCRGPSSKGVLILGS